LITPLEIFITISNGLDLGLAPLVIDTNGINHHPLVADHYQASRKGYSTLAHQTQLVETTNLPLSQGKFLKRTV